MVKNAMNISLSTCYLSVHELNVMSVHFVNAAVLILNGVLVTSVCTINLCSTSHTWPCNPVNIYSPCSIRKFSLLSWICDGC